ncbi:MAG: DUF2683 family protein [archaeon]
MVQSIIDLDEREDRVLNIVKAKFGLKNKSEAVKMITRAYEESFLEPELRPEYIKRLDRINKGKFIKFGSVQELRKAISKG